MTGAPLNNGRPITFKKEARGNLGKAISILSAGIAVTGTGLLVQPVNAKVYFDTDTYGDKELKIATVNKMKQKLRNSILQDPSIAPVLFRLALKDALSFDATSGDGGLDGSILYELDRAENKDLDKAVGTILQIKKELQRTNVVSASDLIAFGGAEALETVGSNRVTVQVGRFDAKSGNKNSQSFDWAAPTDAAVTETFTKAGLDAREIVLLFAAYGEINRIVDETIATRKEEADDDDDSPEFEKYVPTTFGARDAIYGAKIGKADFGVTYLNQLVKDSKKGAPIDPLGNILLSNDKTKAFVTKYASSKVAFLEDVPEAYLKLTLLGEAYTTRNS
jgi:hypothetical protein